MHVRPILASAALAAVFAAPALAQTEISWWHAMTGANNEVVEKIATDFNASQSRLQDRRRCSRAPIPRR